MKFGYVLTSRVIVVICNLVVQAAAGVYAMWAFNFTLGIWMHMRASAACREEHIDVQTSN